MMSSLQKPEEFSSLHSIYSLIQADEGDIEEAFSSNKETCEHIIETETKSGIAYLSNPLVSQPIIIQKLPAFCKGETPLIFKLLKLSHDGLNLAHKLFKSLQHNKTKLLFMIPEFSLPAFSI